MRGLSIEEAIGRRESGRFAVSMLVGVLAAAACLLAAPSLAIAGTLQLRCITCPSGIGIGSRRDGLRGCPQANTSPTRWQRAVEVRARSGCAIGPDPIGPQRRPATATENGYSGSQGGLRYQLRPAAAPPDVYDSMRISAPTGCGVVGDRRRRFHGLHLWRAGAPRRSRAPERWSRSNCTASDSWTLPQGARDFEAHVTAQRTTAPRRATSRTRSPSQR